MQLTVLISIRRDLSCALANEGGFTAVHSSTEARSPPVTCSARLDATVTFSETKRPAAFRVTRAGSSMAARRFFGRLPDLVGPAIL